MNKQDYLNPKETIASEVCDLIHKGINGEYFYDKYSSFELSGKTGTVSACGKNGRLVVKWELVPQEKTE